MKKSSTNHAYLERKKKKGGEGYYFYLVKVDAGGKRRLYVRPADLESARKELREFRQRQLKAREESKIAKVGERRGQQKFYPEPLLTLLPGPSTRFIRPPSWCIAIIGP